MITAGAILFDLDGVLANSIAVVEKSWRIWAREHGFEEDPILKIGHGRRTEEVLQAIAPELATPEEIERFVAIEQSLLDDVQPIPGALEFVMSLPRGAWAIGTSGERVIATSRLRKLGFPIPDVLITAEDVRIGKPNPEVYAKAAAGLGVECSRCVVFEDAPAGIAAARAAGMVAVGVLTSYPAAALDGATKLIQDFRGVKAAIAASGDIRISII